MVKPSGRERISDQGSRSLISMIDSGVLLAEASWYEVLAFAGAPAAEATEADDLDDALDLRVGSL